VMNIARRAFGNPYRISVNTPLASSLQPLASSLQIRVIVSF
jgi:hypothetical protein